MELVHSACSGALQEQSRRGAFDVSRNFDIGTRVVGMSHNFEGEAWELEFDNGYIFHVCADGSWRIVKGKK